MLIAASSYRFAKLLVNRQVHLSLFSHSTKRFASSRLFTEKHEWISIQDDKQLLGRVGISNHAQEALGDVVYVQTPETGAKLTQFEEAGTIESVKAASEITSPVSGEVIAVNSELEEKPGLVNSDCYGEGWLFEIKIEKEEELKKLMDDKQYQKFLEESKDT